MHAIVGAVTYARQYVASLCVLAMSFSAVPALAKSPPNILGDWEVTQVLMTGGLQPQWSVKENDPRLMWRRMRIASDSYVYNNDEKKCTLTLMPGTENASMRTLFEREKTKRPKLMKERFYGRLRDYKLGALAQQPVRILQERCEAIARKNDVTGNWIAVLPDALIVPYTQDALMVLKRPPKEIDPGQLDYCKTAVNASDKVICADRQLWQMQRYTEASLAPLESKPAVLAEELNKDTTTLLAKRQACNGDSDCLYKTLDQHVDTLVQLCMICIWRHFGLRP